MQRWLSNIGDDPKLMCPAQRYALTALRARYWMNDVGSIQIADSRNAWTSVTETKNFINQELGKI